MASLQQRWVSLSLVPSTVHLPDPRRPLTPSYRAFGVHQQQVFGESVVHARQDVGPRVGGALTNQEVPVFPQQLLGVPAAHLAVVPRPALQLLLRPEGHRAHQKKRAGAVHGRRLVEAGDRGRGRALGRRVGPALNGVLEGLWGRRGQRKGLTEEGFTRHPSAVYERR